MKSSLQVGLAVLLIATGLCASAYAQQPGQARTAPQTLSASAKPERMPVAAVAVEAHLKSHVVTSVTVGAPVEATAQEIVKVPAVALKTVVAAR